MLDFYLGAGLLYWLRVAALAGLLGFAIHKARRRWLESAGEHRGRRIFYPWLVLVTGFALYMGALAVFLSPIIILYLGAIVALWVVVPAIVSVLILEFGGRLVEAERTGFWLGAGIIACLAMTVIWFGIFGLAPLLTIPQLWLEYLILASVPAAAAISWWGFLPDGGGGGRGIAETFE